METVTEKASWSSCGPLVQYRTTGTYRQVKIIAWTGERPRYAYLTRCDYEAARLDIDPDGVVQLPIAPPVIIDWAVLRFYGPTSLTLQVDRDLFGDPGTPRWVVHLPATRVHYCYDSGTGLYSLPQATTPTSYRIQVVRRVPSIEPRTWRFDINGNTAEHVEAVDELRLPRLAQDDWYAQHWFHGQYLLFGPPNCELRIRLTADPETF